MLLCMHQDLLSCLMNFDISKVTLIEDLGRRIAGAKCCRTFMWEIQRDREDKIKICVEGRPVHFSLDGNVTSYICIWTSFCWKRTLDKQEFSTFDSHDFVKILD